MPREKAIWAAEIASGNGVASLPLLAAAALAWPPLGWWLGAAWLAAFAVLALLLGNKLVFAARDGGPAFAAGMFGYRVLEMVAAAVGIVRGLYTRRGA